MNKNKLSILFLVLSFMVFVISCTKISAIPPVESEAKEHLINSPRHGEWVNINTKDGASLEAWLVYPERKNNAPVVIVIHEIYGLTDWIRTVADQLAAEGFIAIAPDFLSGKGLGGKGSSSFDKDNVRKAIRALDWDEVALRIKTSADFGMDLPSAKNNYGVIGFCWGGGKSFKYATESSDLKAAVVYYGVSPDSESLSGISVPVLGLYGEDDNRVNSTIPEAEKTMKNLGKDYDYILYPSAGHGFLRKQEVRSGANLQAAKKAWPKMIKFLKKNLE